MIRALATLALVFTQALPWVGGPLFVCIERDGTVCLDGGPQDCDCRVADAADSVSCHDEHFAATSGDDGAAPSNPELTAGDCDCDHQLWEAAPTTVAGRVTAALADLSANAVFSLPAALTPIVTTQGAAIDALPGPSAGAAERILACVVLRC